MSFSLTEKVLGKNLCRLLMVLALGFCSADGANLVLGWRIDSQEYQRVFGKNLSF